MKEKVWVAGLTVLILFGFFIKGKIGDWSQSRENAGLVTLLPEIDGRYHYKLSEAEKEEAISLLAAQRIVAGARDRADEEYYKANVVISFRESVDRKSIHVASVRFVERPDGLLHPVKLFHEHNALARAQTTCRGLGNIGEVVCWEDLQYTETKWDVPAEFMERFDPESFRVYATAFFRLDSAKITYEQGGSGARNSVKRFFTGCDQLDVYSNSNFSKLVLSTDCRSLVRRPY